MVGYGVIIPLQLRLHHLLPLLQLPRLPLRSLDLFINYWGNDGFYHSVSDSWVEVEWVFLFNFSKTNQEVAKDLQALISNLRNHGVLFYRDSAGKAERAAQAREPETLPRRRGGR